MTKIPLFHGVAFSVKELFTPKPPINKPEAAHTKSASMSYF